MSPVLVRAHTLAIMFGGSSLLAVTRFGFGSVTQSSVKKRRRRKIFRVYTRSLERSVMILSKIFSDLKFPRTVRDFYTTLSFYTTLPARPVVCPAERRRRTWMVVCAPLWVSNNGRVLNWADILCRTPESGAVYAPHKIFPGRRPGFN